MTDDEQFESLMLITQFALTSLCYFLGLVALGVEWHRAGIVAGIALALCLTKLSNKGVKRWSLVILTVGAINWLGLFPIERWGPGVIAKIDRLLLPN